MTVVMPHDVVDSEVYIKTPRGHTGIQMDPWISSTWRKTWSFTHSPNKETNEKIRKFKQQRANRRISLHKTAGRYRQLRCGQWCPRPEARQQLHPYAVRTPSPYKKQQPDQNNQPSHQTKKQLHKKRQREVSPADLSTNSTSVNTYHEETDVADEFCFIDLSPESPPEYENGLKPLDYVSKSPVYPHQMVIQTFKMKTPSLT